MALAPSTGQDHPQAQDIIDGIDPNTAVVDIRTLGDAFIVALRE